MSDALTGPGLACVGTPGVGVLPAQRVAGLLTQPRRPAGLRKERGFDSAPRGMDPNGAICL